MNQYLNRDGWFQDRVIIYISLYQAYITLINMLGDLTQIMMMDKQSSGSEYVKYDIYYKTYSNATIYDFYK